jgi:hypothetical protein
LQSLGDERKEVLDKTTDIRMEAADKSSQGRQSINDLLAEDAILSEDLGGKSGVGESSFDWSLYQSFKIGTFSKI